MLRLLLAGVLLLIADLSSAGTPIPLEFVYSSGNPPYGTYTLCEAPSAGATVCLQKSNWWGVCRFIEADKEVQRLTKGSITITDGELTFSGCKSFMMLFTDKIAKAEGYTPKNAKLDFGDNCFNEKSGRVVVGPSIFCFLRPQMRITKIAKTKVGSITHEQLCNFDVQPCGPLYRTKDPQPSLAYATSNVWTTSLPYDLNGDGHAEIIYNQPLVGHPNAIAALLVSLRRYKKPRIVASTVTFAQVPLKPRK